MSKKACTVYFFARYIKRVFFKRKFPDGASTIFIESRSKIVIEGSKNSCDQHFFRGMLTVS